MTSETIYNTISASIDRNTYCRLKPVEIPEGSSCPQDIADSTPESTDISSSCRAQYIDREITKEDFSELKDFLKVLDEAHHEDLGQNSEKKLDDDQHTLERDLETSPKASIDRHRQPDIDRPHLPDIDRHPSDNIDRHPLLHELPGYMIAEEPVEERMQESEASLLAVHEHLRPHICAEAADRFHKRVRRIHDPVKIVVPCVVVEVEIPIPLDRSVHLLSYNWVFADAMYAVASQRDEVDKDPAEAASIKTDQI
ncbi:hypothetical protein F2Q70_00043420 [Brassica cretica]|uniref:Uncharacterized protein n=1 Tax=Brassica cretica TaxID=69181 RepID=A0A8S9KJX2_BRACR|nr:hypothetical protein F2Q70_00043420 [Brassica cretica]KAF3518528.1 hypothetical protein DY000_02060514 [Brassica cretica]